MIEQVSKIPLLLLKGLLPLQFIFNTYFTSILQFPHDLFNIPPNLLANSNISPFMPFLFVTSRKAVVIAFGSIQLAPTNQPSDVGADMYEWSQQC